MSIKNEVYTIVGLGEILWDLLPGGKQFGGAPANFIYHVSALGYQGIIASRIGKDVLGKEIFDYLTNCGLTTKYIQIDSNHSTGTVSVKIDEKGNPEYIIKQNVSWDFFEFNEKWKNLAKKANAIYFGSLSQRSEKSYYTIKEFLKHARKETIIIFDINLRQNFYSTEIIIQSLNASSILKINNAELSILINLLGYQGKKSQEESCKFLVKKYKLDLLCLTDGKNGSLLGAYAISRFRFKGKNNIYFWFLSTRMAPSFLAAITFFVISRRIGLYDTIWLLIIIYILLNLSWVIWMMRSFFDEIPIEIDEACMVDGCTRFSALSRVILPLSKPGLISTTIFCLILSWNEYFFALILTSVNAKTLPAAITSFLTVQGLMWGQMTAAGTVVMLPILIFVAFVQRHLIRGLTMGAVKG